jgi:hypothetical protein
MKLGLKGVLGTRDFSALLPPFSLLTNRCSLKPFASKSSLEQPCWDDLRLARWGILVLLICNPRDRAGVWLEEFSVNLSIA